MSETAADPNQCLALVADSDDTVRERIKSMLMQIGYRVREAADGLKALEAFSDACPQLVLLDASLPKMDGYAVCENLRRHPQGARVPILLMIDPDDPQSLKKGYEAGATDFEIKPIQLEILGYRVRYRAHANATRETARIVEVAEIQRSAHLGSWRWELQHNRVEWSSLGRQIFGLPEHTIETTHEGFLIHVHPGDRAHVCETHIEALKSKQAFAVEYRIIRPDGVQRVIREQAEVILNPVSGRAMVLRATIQDVTELRQAQERIRYLAFYDSLTGLLNRQAFQQELQRSLYFADRHDGMIGVLFVDLDNFKRINDTLGHAMGDALLKVVADRLQRNVRKFDFLARSQNDAQEDRGRVARLGGDEFVLMLTDMESIEVAATVAERLLNLLNQPVQVGEYEVAVTPSIGISIYPHDGQDVDHLLRNADMAMYQAKETGKNTYRFYNESMNARALQRLDLEHKLRQALENDELSLYYQPQVDLSTGALVGVEALLRWHNPSLGWVAPEDFIPLAEETGLIVPIGNWVLQLACRQKKIWETQYSKPLRLAVNLGGLQLRQSDLASFIERLLEETGLRASDLELELTEQSLMANAEDNLDILSRLSGMGVSLSVDDFGTGYSSLRYLKRFRLNKLKIDQSFIKKVPYSADNAAITSTIITLAHTLGLKVIAEGVETDAQQSFLRSHGCDEAQGYLYGQPMTTDDFTAFLLRHEENRPDAAEPQDARTPKAASASITRSGRTP